MNQRIIIYGIDQFNEMNRRIPRNCEQTFQKKKFPLVTATRVDWFLEIKIFVNNLLENLS